MKVFKTKALKWWEVGIIKLSVFCIALAIGAYWPAVFLPYVLPLVVVGVLLGLYAIYFWCKD